MCYFCKKPVSEIGLDVGWLKRDNEYYSCCYDCGLDVRIEGEFYDRIPNKSITH